MVLEQEDFFKFPNSINVMWKNCNLYDKPNSKQTEVSFKQIQDFTNFKKEAADLIDIVYSEHKKNKGKSADENILNKEQGEMLASLVPDLLINAKEKTTGYSTTFAGIILFIDISGFTAMCEKYSQSGTEGTDRMTMTLNKYLGPMVYEIYFHGGDVVKFAGDALLAVWKASLYEYVWSLVHSAIVCSKYIQHTFGSYKTDVGIILKVKAAIAAGNLTFCIIGPPDYNHFIVVGPPVEELKETERMCNAGDVLVAPSAWRECSKRNYYYEIKQDCALILRIIYNPSDIKLKFFEFPRRNLSESSINISVSSSTSSRSSMAELSNKEAAARPTLQSLYRHEDVNYIQGFIIKQVVQQIEAEQSLDFLTEMRTITTMFVNLIPYQKTDVDKLIVDVNEAYFIISQLVTQSLGSVNLVGLFDKDVMFLVTFGLRGEDHEGETARSLKCAYDIRMALKDKDYVKNISVGVTCGMTYCGIVGHVVRKCYTVLGSTVNKAARLMCYYENKVTCDEETFKNSNLPLDQFLVQESKQLKGIKDAGIIYEYTGENEKRKKFLENDYGNQNPLGHAQNIKIFMDNFKFKYSNCIIVSGIQGVGKTFLLKQYFKRTTVFRPIFITLSSYHVSLKYYLIRKIFKKVLGNTKWKNKEDIFTSNLGNENLQLRFHLNTVFQTNFDDNNEDTDSTKQMAMFRILADKILKNCVILIDDAHFVDYNSLPFLKQMINMENNIVVLSMLKFIDEESEFHKFVSSLRGQTIGLSILEYNLIVPVSCRIIGVDALPKEITTILLNRSRGNPGWCATFLRYLIDTGKLSIVKKPYGKVKADNEMIISSSFNSFESEMQKIEHSFFNPNEIKVAVINNDINLTSSSIYGIVMSSFDRLVPYEQVLLKCASCLGMEFSLKQLIKVLPEQPVEHIERVIRHLFEMNILQCKTTAVWNEIHNESKKICSCEDKKKSALLCLDDFEDLENSKYCKRIRFTVSFMQDRIYELMTISQSKLFHLKAFKYLSELKISCKICKRIEGESADHIGVLNTNNIKRSILRSVAGTGITYKTALRHLSVSKPVEILDKLHTFNRFESCSCLKLKKIYFETLNKHGQKAEKQQKLISSLMSHAEVLIDLEEKNEAINIINLILKHVDDYDSLKQNITLGRTYILAGRGRLMDNDFTGASKYFKKSIDILNRTLTLQSWGPIKYIKPLTKDVYISEIIKLKVSAYNFLCDANFMRLKIDKVHLYASKALKNAMNLEYNFIDLCLIYTNLLLSLNVDCSNLLFQFIENQCFVNLHPFKPKEAAHIGMVFTAIFRKKLLEGKPLDETLKPGMIALEMARKCEANEVHCQILPLIVYSLLYRGYLGDAIVCLMEYRKQSEHFPSKFYVMCLDFLLYGGIGVVDVKECIKHARNLNQMHEETALDRLLYVKVLMWCLRNKNIDQAQMWLYKLGPLPKKPSNDQFLVDFLYCQCLVLNTVYLYNKNEVSLLIMEDQIKKFLNFTNLVESKLAPAHVFAQYLILLNKSYLYKLSGDNRKSDDYLTKVKRKCEQSDNVLFSEWVDHCKTVWSDPNHYSVNNWVEHSQSGCHFSISQFDIISWQDIMFSFPLIKRPTVVMEERIDVV